MRKITLLEYISLDGVIQAPGGPGEDSDAGFPYGGWSAPFDDPVLDEAVETAHAAVFDLLLGRRTYDIWAGYWPHAGESPIATKFNGAVKYVATHRPESLGWGPAENLGTDIVAGIRRLKAQEGPDLVAWGSSSVAAALLEHGLADEVVLIVVPVILGTGKRVFPEGTPPRELKLIRSRTGTSGLMIHTFEPAGQLRTGSYT
ncbi:MAG TPA: dihydrofolate reductase family protein [Hyphomonas sp.]|nr:deaminase [Hyphomonas sp.]HRJ02619.1 dihydrofolate reductase family protein [Hyphomonas sp.]HRK67314.1 dihydrofolate reductase family protein [Hyphomonas sp.]